MIIFLMLLSILSILFVLISTRVKAICVNLRKKFPLLQPSHSDVIGLLYLKSERNSNKHCYTEHLVQ